ncbi:helix-turn-helix domain-containing protein [Methylicorpusculum sp.]|jgi:excisionase family DNA binding protein|uniref:helix-turn-helix domain-containing protein n=1 Tax=Methylicorpusculum sp. TaxID=2713644 RepID=UPI0027207C47|nr:helix-turn-helix domain-containing protein [Methylicorpusculum sp.]MDO8845902.1 helix-turn-helix domain-containing protein [Methylicorpusculum sp.]MDP2178613.1 helix-turn-helix domain-containing protein [Methylicorpusculum sp.]MDP3531598.1 helix-turn-helix domain-containing protein [Methylicorpusculum sp.]
MTYSHLSLEIDVLTDTEGAAVLLSIPAATLTKWRSTGEVRIPFVKIGRQVKYRTSDLKRFVESSTIK